MNLKKKHWFSCLCLFLSISFTANAQNNWTPWVTVYQDEAYPTPHFVQISFKMGIHCLNYSFFRTNSNFSIKYGTVSFYFDYLDCDGKVQPESVSVELDKPKIDAPTGYWFIGSKVVTEFRNVTFYQPKEISSTNTNNIGGGGGDRLAKNYTDSNGDKTSGSKTAANTNTTNYNYSNQTRENSQQQTDNSIDNYQNNGRSKTYVANSNRNNGNTLPQLQQFQQQQQNTAQVASTINELATGTSNLFAAISRRSREEKAMLDAIDLENTKKRIASAENGNSIEMFNLAQQAYTVKQYSVALNWYFKAADAGNAKAMENLYDVYTDGLAVPIDYAKANYWLKKAADYGYPIAIKRVGINYHLDTGCKNQRIGLAYLLLLDSMNYKPLPSRMNFDYNDVSNSDIPYVKSVIADIYSPIKCNCDINGYPVDQRRNLALQYYNEAIADIDNQLGDKNIYRFEKKYLKDLKKGILSDKAALEKN